MFENKGKPSREQHNKVDLSQHSQLLQGSNANIDDSLNYENDPSMAQLDEKSLRIKELMDDLLNMRKRLKKEEEAKR